MRLEYINSERAALMLLQGYMFYLPGEELPDGTIVPEGHLYAVPVGDKARAVDRVGPRLIPASPDAVSTVRDFYASLSELADQLKGGQP